MIDWAVFALSIGAVMVFISAMFAVATKLRRLDVVDAAWGGNFVVAAVVSFVLQPAASIPTILLRMLVTILVILWAMRLSGYIIARIKRHPEDPRYVAMRKKWKGNVAVNAYFRIFFTQGILASLIVLPVLLLNTTKGEVALEPWPLAAIVVGLVAWIIGISFEAVADAQLKRFLADPKNKGKLMTKGVWKYSRHPNYFGEIKLWWGIFIIGLALPYGLAGIIGPLVITVFIVFISGVPLLEKKYEGRPGWKEYKRRTSMLLPLPPKSKALSKP